jgi:hypothetical protein
VADEMPKLPVRAAVYVLPDGNVQFGALFEDLLPVARALGKPGTPSIFPQRENPVAKSGEGKMAGVPSFEAE